MVPISVWQFLLDHRSELAGQAGDHLRLVGQALAWSVPAAVALGIGVHRRPRLSATVVGAAAVIFTVPSLALFGVLVAPLGLGSRPAVAALALYSLLPVVRNTVVGLAGVPAGVLEAARGMGMTERQCLVRVRLPLAAPVILAGVRVAAVAAVGMATIAALIAGGGLGESIFEGLRVSDKSQVLAATLVIVALALAIDGLLALGERAVRRKVAR